MLFDGVSDEEAQLSSLAMDAKLKAFLEQGRLRMFYHAETLRPFICRMWKRFERGFRVELSFKGIQEDLKGFKGI